MTGKRLAALIGLRDRARRVLQSQNEGWPEEHRDEARRELNWAYDRFVAAYGPINKTTFGETADGNVIRRMPNLVKFREDPDAMLVMSLEDYDEVTGKAAKAAILLQGRGRPHARRSRRFAPPRRDCWSRSTAGRGRSALHRPPVRQAGGGRHRRTGRSDLPRSRHQDLGDCRRLSLRQRAGQARRRRSRRAGASPATPRRFGRAARRRAARRHRRQSRGAVDSGRRTSRRSPPICSGVAPSSMQVGHLKKDAVWSLEAGYAAEAVGRRHVANTARPASNGVTLLELALNMKTPAIYDTIQDGDREERVVNQEATLAAREKQKLIKERFRLGASPIPTVPSGWCGSTTTPTTTCGRACSTARTSTSRA